jgi:hypothetical protein
MVALGPLARWITIFALAAIALTSVGISGCSESRAEADLSVRIQSGFGRLAEDKRFTLRCDPSGGDMPNRAALCAMLAEHPEAMLFRNGTRSSCLGGIGIPPAVSVSGTYRGEKVKADVRLCDWPGGVAGAAYWAAVDSPRDLETVSAHLHCDDDPVLQRVPIRWASVRACLRGFLRPHRPSGPSVRVAREAITRALRVAAFAPYAGIFPRVPGRQECVVRAGAPGNIYRGVCSASVRTGAAGAHTVTFSQDFGRNGTYTWIIRVPAHRPSRLVEASGDGLVQLHR